MVPAVLPVVPPGVKPLPPGLVAELARLTCCLVVGWRLTSTPPMKASPLTVISGPPGVSAPETVCSKAPMMPTPVTRTLASSGTMTSQPPMIATMWIDTSRSSNRASRMSISPPPMNMKAVKVLGTTQSPLREKPPRIATAPAEVAWPPNLAGSGRRPGRPRASSRSRWPAGRE